MISNDYEKIFKDRGILCGGCVCVALHYKLNCTHILVGLFLTYDLLEDRRMDGITIK